MLASNITLHTGAEKCTRYTQNLNTVVAGWKLQLTGASQIHLMHQITTLLYLYTELILGSILTLRIGSNRSLTQSLKYVTATSPRSKEPLSFDVRASLIEVPSFGKSGNVLSLASGRSISSLKPSTDTNV